MLSTKQTTAVISLRVQVQKKRCLNSMVFIIGTRTLLIASLGLINIKEVKAYNQWVKTYVLFFIYSVNVITSSNNFAGSLTFKLTNIPNGNKNLPIVWRFSLNLAGKFINNFINKTVINLKKRFEYSRMNLR